MANTYSGPFSSCTCSGGSSFTPYMPTQQIINIGSGTYIPPTSPRAPLYICVKLRGGGGGGSGSSKGVDGGDGGSGGDSTFGGVLTAHGGTGGTFSDVGIGGDCTISTSASGTHFKGQNGEWGTGCYYDTGFGAAPNILQIYLLGGSGGNSQFSGAGTSGSSNLSAAPNTGSGGAGGNINAASNGIVATTVFNSGAGGGGGGYLEFILPSASYEFSIGLGGLAGIAGNAGKAGGAGSNGGLIITEHYQ